jgi:hypothetical protein
VVAKLLAVAAKLHRAVAKHLPAAVVQTIAVSLHADVNHLDVTC